MIAAEKLERLAPPGAGEAAAAVGSISSLAATQARQPSKSTIEIYARIRPSMSKIKSKEVYRNGAVNEPNPLFAVDSDTPYNGEPQLHFTIPKDEAAGLINNQREKYDFRFDRVFQQSTKQEEVFDYVAKGVVDSVLEGYNGTIFAYGQTGSGKTFTITGGAEKYADRGIIPRSIQYIFKQAQERKDVEINVKISYLEIYNEVGYDLLEGSREAKKLEDLPKVSIQEDEDGSIHLRNLQTIPAATEEQALDLLFLGDTNRIFAETPSNPQSSRSHCLFIINVTTRLAGSDVIRKSQLYLVDLAGSERIGKTGVTGNLQKEAKYINLSLHHLERVIVALEEKARGKRAHIPYRDSFMTNVLRHSLGGNCKTTMIATLAVEKELIDETISTCRFAQRVALISNTAELNEELDPKLLIARLKRQVEQLKAELALARGDGATDEPLQDYEKEKCKMAVDDYLADTSNDATLQFSDFRKIQEAFRICKTIITNYRSGKGVGFIESSKSQSLNGRSESALGMSKSHLLGSNETTNMDHQVTVKKLQQQIELRDNEIYVLVDMMKKKRPQCHVMTQTWMEGNAEMATSTSTSTTSGSRWNAESGSSVRDIRRVSSATPDAESVIQASDRSNRIQAESTKITNSVSNVNLSPDAIHKEKVRLFDEFRMHYKPYEWIEECKNNLKQMYSEAKALGENANSCKNRIGSLKSAIEQRRAEIALARIHSPGQYADNVEDEREIQLRQEMEQEKTKYKRTYDNLKDMKKEIEHLQHLLENARVKMQKDFESWQLEQRLKRVVENNTQDDIVRAVANMHRDETSLQSGTSGRGLVGSSFSNVQSISSLGNSSQPRSSSQALATTLNSHDNIIDGYHNSASINIGNYPNSFSSSSGSVRIPLWNQSTTSLAGNPSMISSSSPSLASMDSSRNSYSSLLSSTNHRFASPEPAGNNINKSMSMFTSTDSLAPRSTTNLITNSTTNMTGNPKVDADIAAFYKAKQDVLKSSLTSLTK